MKAALTGTLAACAWLCAGTASAQKPAAPAPDFPAKPIRIVVPFVAGGPMDAIGRTVGTRMGQSVGQNFVLDNRPGAGGIIGTEVVAKAAPDGYTMLHTSSAHAILPAFNKLPYDPVRDFAPITAIARTVGYVLAVHPSLPVKSVRDLVTLARAQPGRLNYGSSGFGGVLHLATELLMQETGIRMTHIQYKGIAQLTTDLAGGQIELAFLTPSNAVSLVHGKRVRPIGISAARRWTQMPEVPTIGEAGVKGFEYYAWFGIWYPAGVPVEYVGRMHAEVVKAIAHADVKQRFEELGFEGVASRPEDFARLVQEDIAAMRKLAARIGPAPQ